MVFFAVFLLAAAFLPVPRCAGVAFFGEVAFSTRPPVRFTAEAIFLSARPVVPFAGVDFAVLFAADVRLPAALVAVVFLAVVDFAVVRLVAVAVAAVAFFAGAVLRAVVVLRAGLVFFAAVVVLVAVDFFAAGLVFLAAGFLAAGFLAAVADFAAVVEVRSAAPVDRADVALDEVPVLDARRAAGRVVALVPTTMSFSSLRTFRGFVSFGDSGVSGIRLKVRAGPA